MHRIDHNTAVALLPAPEVAGTPGYFTKGDPAGGFPATVVTHDWANAIQEEIANAILGAGLELDKAKANQLLEAIIAINSDSLGFSHANAYAPGSMGAKLKRMVCANDAPFNADNTGATGASAALAAARDYVSAGGGGGIVWIRSGRYLLDGDGPAKPDGFTNGFLMPDTNGNTDTKGGVELVGDGPDTVLLAGADNMIVVRGSRHYSGVRNLMIDGNGHVNVWAGGLVPEDMTQTTEWTTHSFQNWNVWISNCREGIVVMPGPTVAGADSGCFYNTIKVHAKNVTRALWTKADITGAKNRITRSKIDIIAVYGNTGVQVDYGSELQINAWVEFQNSGVTPNATPVAVLIGNDNLANIKVSGYAEACTRGLVMLDPIVVDDSGWGQSMARDASQGFSNFFQFSRANIAKFNNGDASLSFANPSFVRFTADPAQVNSKTLALFINDTKREEWAASGEKVYYGTHGNIKYVARGDQIDFSFNGANFIKATGADASLYHVANFHGWQKADGTDILTLTELEFVPRKDNVTSFGILGLRLSNVFSKNIRSGTGATLETSGAGSPEGVVVAAVGSMYRRTDGAAGTRLYWKNVGADANGWVAIL